MRVCVQTWTLLTGAAARDTLVVLYDDLFATPVATLNKIFSHLGVQQLPADSPILVSNSSSARVCEVQLVTAATAHVPWLWAPPACHVA